MNYITFTICLIIIHKTLSMQLNKVDLLKNLTNFEPQTSVEYGVNKFIEWYLSEYNKH